MIAAIAALLLAQAAPLPAPSGTLKMDDQAVAISRIGATSHGPEYVSAEIWIGTEAKHAGSGLLLEVPLQTGTFPMHGLIAPDAGQMRYSSAANEKDRFETWDSETKHFMLKRDGEKPATGTAAVTYKLASQDQYRIQTVLNVTFSSTLRRKNADGSVSTMRIEGEIKDVPFSIPFRVWRPNTRQAEANKSMWYPGSPGVIAIQREDVQKELALTDDQKAKLAALRIPQTWADKTWDAVSAILTPEQRQRANELGFQAMDATMLYLPWVRPAFALAPGQITSIDTLRDTFLALPEVYFEDRVKAASSLCFQIRSYLTPEQIAKLDASKGKPFTFDPAARSVGISTMIQRSSN